MILKIEVWRYKPRGRAERFALTVNGQGVCMTEEGEGNFPRSVRVCLWTIDVNQFVGRLRSIVPFV